MRKEEGFLDLAQNAVSFDPDTATQIYLRVGDYASIDGVDIDALEIVKDGAYRAPATCAGIADPSCGDEKEAENSGKTSPTDGFLRRASFAIVAVM